MEVHFSPELEAKLDRVATEQGRDPASLVQEAVEHLLDYDEWFAREVEKGLEQIDSGEVLNHDEVWKRLEKRLAEKRLQR